ncbi:hypothetical protein SaccyDRAFT_2737 [Saccharomonospora cyanea NA-134]|uniref:Uncharacterized protein n=1 Tax=Saccharomonospora cyanea NA-134 TaxID=882082 RepID=H5XGP0_9PSEU|nr:hypothetical protein SaccyDRAFT_2737 [Saccharomonospora cyanea NA-134]
MDPSRSTGSALTGRCSCPPFAWDLTPGVRTDRRREAVADS